MNLTFMKIDLVYFMKYKPVQYLWLALIAIPIASIVNALTLIDIQPTNYFTAYAIQIVSAILLISLSQVLGNSINRPGQKKKTTQIELLEDQKEISGIISRSFRI